MLIEPAVHGDARGFFLETCRANALAELGITRRVRAGQPVALGARRAARHALPARHGEARALRARRDPRRGRGHPARLARASGAGRATSWTTRPPRSCTCRTASRTASACSRTSRRRDLPLLGLLRPGARGAASASTTPRWGSSGRTIELVTSERDAQAPLLQRAAERLSAPLTQQTAHQRALARVEHQRVEGGPVRPATPPTATAATAGRRAGSSAEPERRRSTPASSRAEHVGGDHGAAEQLARAARRTRAARCAASPGTPTTSAPAVATRGALHAELRREHQRERQVQHRGARERASRRARLARRRPGSPA